MMFVAGQGVKSVMFFVFGPAFPPTVMVHVIAHGILPLVGLSFAIQL